MKKYNIVSIVVALILFVFSISLGFARTFQDKGLSDFVSANIDYKDGKYEDAIRKYEGILKSGIESGALYYNLGNSYFKAGCLGEAVLNYEKARLFIPRDSDLNFNYKFAVSSLDNYAGNVEKKSLFNMLNNYLAGYTFGEIFLLLNFFVIIVFFLHILSLFLKFSSNINKVSMPILLGIIVVLSSFLFVKFFSASGMSVIVKSTSANFEPKDDSTKHFDLPEGVKVKIIKDEFDWLKIKRLDGKMGWIRADSLERIHPRKYN